MHDHFQTTGDRLRGVIVPVITPVDRDDRVDEDAFRQVVRYLIDAGVHGLFVGGSAGEGPLLTMTEWTRLMEFAWDEVAGRIPLIGGVMETSTRRTLDKIDQLQRLGYQYYAVAPTYYFPLRSGSQQLRLFGSCKETFPEMEMVVYNIPSFTGSCVDLETFIEMARRGWFRYCKDSSERRDLMLALINQGRELGIEVIVGDERLIVDGLWAGSCGMIPVGANVEPRTYLRLYEAGLKRDRTEMLRQHDRVLKILDVLLGGDSWLAGIKYALSMRGMGNGKPISPLEPTDSSRKALIDALESTGTAL